jgi:alanine racemase
MGVIKSDAYGHGALAVGEVLAASGAAWLAVASVDEGCQLRLGGIKIPILVLSPTPSWAISTALKDNLDLTITSFNQLNELISQAQRQEKPIGVHLKMDTGMHRLGFDKDAIPKLIDQLNLCPQMRLVSIFSHLAKADDPACTKKQNDIFDQMLAIFSKGGKIPDFVHIASSEASRRFPFAHHDMVRVGINLFGLEPCEISQDLLPVLALRGRINQTSTIAKGESVGYGLTWTAERETKLAVVPIGYADGVDRRLSNHMRGLLSGHVVPQVGRISMDQMIFDVSDVANAAEGDVITLIGSEMGSDRGQGRTHSGQPKSTIALAEWAQTLGTITYELACRLRIRLPRIYTRSSSSVLPGVLKSQPGSK